MVKHIFDDITYNPSLDHKCWNVIKKIVQQITTQNQLSLPEKYAYINFQNLKKMIHGDFECVLTLLFGNLNLGVKAMSWFTVLVTN